MRKIIGIGPSGSVGDVGPRVPSVKVALEFSRIVIAA
jgi:hypothetical protein